MIRATSLLAALALSLAGPATSAAAFPDRPIRLIVPFAAGGPADSLARWLGARLATSLGQPVIVDNKAGASGMIGTQAAVIADADGHTLIFSSVGAVAIAPYLSEKVPYDPERDLTPVVRVVTAPTVLVTSAAGRFHNVGELVAAAKADPGKITFASAGTGTTTHLGNELLKREAGIDMTHVPYRGAAPAITDIIGGTADVLFADAPVVLPFIKSGKLRSLAIGTPERAAALPDTPTTREAGYGKVLVNTWYGILAPAKTPRETVMKLNGAVNEIIATPEARAYFAEQGVQPDGGTPQAFGAFIKDESTLWTTIARSVGVKLQ
jgi:tripartite-type tricarboxylate transporter receptor subunit TctC